MKKSISLIILLGFLFGGVFASPSLTFAQSNTNITYGENADYEKELERLGSCSFTEWTPCLLEIYYDTVLSLSHYLAYITGAILDYFLAYSIDSDSYTGVNNEFVERGWSVIRDIANITFIFSLLYVAIMHILQADSGKTKKFLKDIIIAALLINFSLFFTKVIIDAGNILARAFYNNIEVENDDNTDYKTLSQGIASYVNPQSILTSKFFNPVTAPGRPPSPPGSGWIFLVLVMSTIVNVVLSLTFLSVFLLFAARVIGLWFMMIFSPLAFVSIAFPWGKGVLGRFSFSNWLKETVSLSFMAPVFLFFLFLLIMFLQIVYTSSVPVADRSSIQQFLSIIIPFVSIILILTMAKKQAKEMAGEVGEQTMGFVNKFAGTVATFGLGSTVWASGALLRSTVGKYAASKYGSESLKRKAANNRFYRTLHKFSGKVANSSLDVRNTGLGKRTSSLLNQGFATAGFQGVGLGEGTKKGGYTQRLEAYQNKKERYKDDIREDDSAIQDVTYQSIQRDAAGNVMRDAAGNPITISRTVKKSVIEAETDLLRKQNEHKKDDRARNILDSAGNILDTKNLDYDGWVKERERAEKNRKQKESDYAEAQRAYAANRTAANLTAMNNAEMAKRTAKERHEGVNRVIKGIESNWETEEKDFKEIQKARDKKDVENIRNYAKSVKMDGLSYLYELANLRAGMAKEARTAASANLSLAAEKAEKKAQAEAKKDNK